jgi:hypothetical protein
MADFLNLENNADLIDPARKFDKQAEWVETSKKAGYEGAGVIFYVFDRGDVFFILGINKDNKAEYVGGKIEKTDKDLVDTVQRETKEETGLNIERNRFDHRFKITGGTTGFPSFVFLVQITPKEFLQMKSEDGTFRKFIKTLDMFGDGVPPNVIDSDGNVYNVRNFNYKYVYPQIKVELEAYLKNTIIKGKSFIDTEIPITFIGVIAAIVVIWFFRK